MIVEILSPLDHRFITAHKREAVFSEPAVVKVAQKVSSLIDMYKKKSSRNQVEI